MQTITLEPLRWQEVPSRITVHANDSHLSVYYQVTRPSFVPTICCGRPVEELPRIIPVLAPAHHLTAALALDRLFQAEPPELARNMRTALLQAQYCSAHLRKIFFLMTSRQEPFAGFHDSDRSPRPSVISKRVLEKMMHHAALAQEAEDILGGRHDHPLTAVAGGVSRYIKEGHYERLTDIGSALCSYALELAEFMRTEILADGGLLSLWPIEIPALAGLHQTADDQILLTPPKGGGLQQFNADRIGEIIALQQETWTYQPFAYLKEKGWQGLDPSQGLFFIGPLARFNADRAVETPLAEEERHRLIACLGPPPVYKLTAAFGALVVEFIQAAETLQSLCSPEKLSGPALRTLPGKITAGSTWAALEAPQGLTWHQYHVSDDGMVQTVTIIDSHTANNALKCMLTRQLVAEALERKEDWTTIKEKAAVALLPF